MLMKPYATNYAHQCTGRALYYARCGVMATLID